MTSASKETDVSGGRLTAPSESATTPMTARSSGHCRLASQIPCRTMNQVSSLCAQTAVTPSATHGVTTSAAFVPSDVRVPTAISGRSRRLAATQRRGHRSEGSTHPRRPVDHAGRRKTHRGQPQSKGGKRSIPIAVRRPWINRCDPLAPFWPHPTCRLRFFQHVEWIS